MFLALIGCSLNSNRDMEGQRQGLGLEGAERGGASLMRSDEVNRRSAPRPSRPGQARPGHRMLGNLWLLGVG